MSVTEVPPEVAARIRALEELIDRLEHAWALQAPPPTMLGQAEPVRLADLVDQAGAQLPAKYRAHVLKLERQIRAELARVQAAAGDTCAQLTAAGAPAFGIWAYHAGLLTGGLIHFTGQRPPAPKPTPPGWTAAPRPGEPGGRIPKVNR